MGRPKRDRPVGYAPPLIDAEILARVEAWRQAQPPPARRRGRQPQSMTLKAAFEQLLDVGLKDKQRKRYACDHN